MIRAAGVRITICLYMRAGRYQAMHVTVLCLTVVAAVGMNGRQRCDDIKAQLDVVSDQIKQAERAQHEQQHDLTAAAATAHSTSSSIDHNHTTSRASSRSVSPPALDSRSASPARQDDDLETKVPGGKQEKKRKRTPESLPDPRSKGEHEKKRHRAAERDGSKKTTRQVPIEEAPGDKDRKRTAGDISADVRGGHRPAGKEVEAAQKKGNPAVGGVNELPQLKKKRHLLYKQLQEARQQVVQVYVTVFCFSVVTLSGSSPSPHSKKCCGCYGCSCIVGQHIRIQRTHILIHVTRVACMDFLLAAQERWRPYYHVTTVITVSSIVCYCYRFIQQRGHIPMRHRHIAS